MRFSDAEKCELLSGRQTEDEQVFTEVVGSGTNGPRFLSEAGRVQDLAKTSPSGSMDRPTLDTPTSTPVMMEESESLLSGGCCSPGGAEPDGFNRSARHC